MPQLLKPDPLVERPDWTAFRSLNTITQCACVRSEQLAQLVGKELTDNALDACGLCRVGWLDEDQKGFFVEDDGPGLPGENDDEIARLFSINRSMLSSKRHRRPLRGALGNGLRVVAGAVLASQGKLTVHTRGRSLDIHIDEENGEAWPYLLGRWEPRGTRIEVTLGDSISHRNRALGWAKAAIRMVGTGGCYQGKSSPFWYDSSAFYDLLNDSGSRTVRDFISDLDGCANPKAGTIAAEFKGRRVNELDRDEADRLLSSARKNARPVKPAKLGFVGEQTDLGTGYSKEEDTIDYSPVGSQMHSAQLPVVVEAWAKPASAGREPWVALFVNRTRVVGFSKAAMEAPVGSGMSVQFGKTRLVLKDAGRKAFRLTVNIQTPHMPIITTGKEPDIWEFRKLVFKAASKAIRIAKRSAPRANDGTRKSQRAVIEAAIPAGAAEASTGGRYRFSQRQLFYAIRPKLLEVFPKEASYGHFTRVLARYERQHGRIPRMYRDVRGRLYHPHTRQSIQLGTLAVEGYERPPWTFNKILYIEKEGLFQILISEHWPEMNDCALMTSKGFSSGSARDLIDLLAEHTEECLIFCIHDADAAGSMIYQTLDGATSTRDARKVKVSNLGLDPAEALAMGLAIEPVVRKRGKKGKLSVANYLSKEEKVWLQEKRIELNAMSSQQFIEWLNQKMAPYAGKVIPPDPVCDKQLDEAALRILRRDLTAKILREADIESKVDIAFKDRSELLTKAKVELDAAIRSELGANPAKAWVSAVESIAEKICSIG